MEGGKPVTQYAFSFDIVRCSGCMACVVACQDQNDFAADESGCLSSCDQA